MKEMRYSRIVAKFGRDATLIRYERRSARGSYSVRDVLKVSHASESKAGRKAELLQAHVAKLQGAGDTPLFSANIDNKGQ